MPETKPMHTPGPWLDSPGDEIVTQNGQTVARFWTRPSVPDKQLMIAAPDMLELAHAGYALSTWAASIRWHASETNTAEWLEDLRRLIVDYQTKYNAAVAKAKGEANANR